MTYHLMLGDCLERLPEVPDGSVDLILCDPPYGTTENPWDKKIPFDKLWAEWNRVLKPNGVVLVHCQQRFTAEVIQSNPRAFRYMYVWDKHQITNFLNAKKQPLRRCEQIAVFYRGQPTYNPQMRKGKPQVKARGRGHESANYRHYRNKDFVAPPRVCEDYYPTDLISDCPAIRRKGGHPTEKPVKLCEFLIKTYSNEGDTVLDCCMGGGTTGVACVRLNRKFIGIEFEPKYYDMAIDRIVREDK